jgi:hypothetical protein
MVGGERPMAIPRSLRFAPALLAGLAACGDNQRGIATPAECNPLGGARCLLPFPISLYQVDDPSTPTGVRLDLAAGSLPVNEDKIPIAPDLYNRRDGFSPAAPILVSFPDGVDDSNLPRWTDLDASLAPSSPTVLIDMDTGELVPHFAELESGARGPEQQALYIRPAALLAGGRRYAVAIKKTLRAADGSALPVPEGFGAILDDSSTDHERLERVRPRYPAIFAALASHGIEPDDLVVAWDFVTGSREGMDDACGAQLP